MLIKSMKLAWATRFCRQWLHPGRYPQVLLCDRLRPAIPYRIRSLSLGFTSGKVLSVETLAHDSKQFLSQYKVPSPTMKVTRLKLLTAWQHELFQIPSTNKRLLRTAAEIIYNLVQGLLEDSSSAGRKLKHSHKTLDFVSTAVFALGRVAPFDPSAPLRAEKLVELVLETVDADSSKSLGQVFSALCYCWSHELSSVGSLSKAKAWMDAIIRDLPGQPIEVVTVNSILRAYARWGKIDEMMEILDDVSNHSFVPNPSTYETIIQGVLEAGRPEGPELAYRALQKAIEEFDGAIPAAPLAQLIARYMNMRRGDPEHVEQILNQVITMETNKSSFRLLESRHFAIAMSAWSSKGNYHRTRDIFTRLEGLHSEGYADLKPSYQMFCTLLSSLTKERRAETVEIAESFIDGMESMLDFTSDDSIGNNAYNILLDVLATAPGVKDRAPRMKKTAQHMDELASQYNNENLRPDKVSYTALLRAIVLEKPRNWEDHVGAILKQMESSPRESLHPDAVTYTLVFDSFLQCGDNNALGRAIKLKEEVRKRHAKGVSEARMDAIMYTTIMKVCTKTNDVETSDRQLHEMIAEYQQGVIACQPTEQAFLTAIGGWARSGRPDAFDGALRLYNLMLQLCRNGNKKCRPSKKIFGELFLILAILDNPSGLQRADRLLGEMKTFEIVPDRLILNLYLRICSIKNPNSEDRRDAFQKAHAVFTSMQGDVDRRADAKTYISMVYAAWNNIEDHEERLAALAELFSQVPATSSIADEVNRCLRRVLSDEEYKKVVSLCSQRP